MKHLNQFTKTNIIQFLAAFLLAFVLSGCSRSAYIFTSFREPATDGLYLLSSTDGYHWADAGGPYLKPEVGGKLMRDPSVVQGPDGVFHLVWTTNWKGDKGFGYASSRDLVTWSPQQFIPVMAHEPEVVNVWAPEIFYDDEQKRYIIIWASTVPFRFEKGEEDEKNNHRMYYTTTTDFKTFSKAALFLDPGFSVIDAVIVKQQRSDYTLILKDNTRPNRNIKVAKAGQVLGPYQNVSAPFTGFLTEGPSVVKVKNEWLIYFDQYRDKTYGAVCTKDFSAFENINHLIKVPEGHKHGTIAKIPRRVMRKLPVKR